MVEEKKRAEAQRQMESRRKIRLKGERRKGRVWCVGERQAH